ncbi:hypothetical protein F53441_10199 [Fusarium austroafricanum]|uniref:Uncharacterized protein n=1 Tax=Fusarium austroafricanum TaxID=2364996 RepID=A0A8H4KA11_9HYPO|nr:hypothetical protein F53441_10199 [Fusarium austroafricanum]
MNKARPALSGSALRAKGCVTLAKTKRWSSTLGPASFRSVIHPLAKHSQAQPFPGENNAIASAPPFFSSAKITYTHAAISAIMSHPICPMPLDEIFRDMLGKEKETNPVKKLYDDAFKADIARWIASCAVIGLSAGIISKSPGHQLLAASAFNLAVGSLHFFAFKIPVNPQGLTNPRPPMWYNLLLALSTTMWLAAFTVMFVLREDIDAYHESALEKRRAGLADNISTGTVAMLDNLSIACGCFGICAFLFCFKTLSHLYGYADYRGNFKLAISLYLYAMAWKGSFANKMYFMPSIDDTPGFWDKHPTWWDYWGDLIDGAICFSGVKPKNYDRDGWQGHQIRPAGRGDMYEPGKLDNNHLGIPFDKHDATEISLDGYKKGGFNYAMPEKDVTDAIFSLDRSITVRDVVRTPGFFQTPIRLWKPTLEMDHDTTNSNHSLAV